MSQVLAEAPATTTTSGGHYVRNMIALWQQDPRLAAAIDAVHPESVPLVEPARDGQATVKIFTDKGAPLYLHSRYRPQQEADSWAATIKCEDRYALVVNGFGLGYHIKSLFAKLPEDA